MTGDRGDLVYEILSQVRPLSLVSARAVGAALREHGLTVGMRAVLDLLAHRGPSPVPALAADLGVTRQAVQRVVDDLRGRGLVEARANPAHRRSVLIAATSAGNRVFAGVHADEVRRLGEMLTDVPDADLVTATRVLEALRHDVARRAELLEADPS